MHACRHGSPVYIHIYIYAYIYTYMYVFICTKYKYIYIYTDTHIHPYMCKYIYTHTHLSTHSHTHMHTYIYICIYTCSYVCTHAQGVNAYVQISVLTYDWENLFGHGRDVPGVLVLKRRLPAGAPDTGANDPPHRVVTHMVVKLTM